MMIYRRIYITACFSLFALFTYAQQLAFPGAEGFGRFATGGRGGQIYHVTNLDDSGAGSFRDAVSVPGRTVVFDVAGVINIKSKIAAKPRITVAGQTAPGDGIVIYGTGVGFADSSIIRYVRFRGSINMARGACTVTADNSKDVIFDHVSVEWGRWDDFHIKGTSNITLQYCLIGEPIDPQRFGALFEDPHNVTVHHCLWIDNHSRNPKAKAGIEYINNVVYNWGVNGLVGGHSGANHYQDVIGNYFIAGPNSGHAFLGMFTTTDHVYHRGNYVDMNKDGILNGRLVSDTDFVSKRVKPAIIVDSNSLKGATLQRKPNFKLDVTVDEAAVAYQKVLAGAGASLHRDDVDNRIIGYLHSLGKEGKIFKTEAEAGGQGNIEPATALRDTDGDGIPDTWETAHGLDLKNAKDANLMSGKSGYTNLENYLNSLVPAN
ncbi:polysaccharide lyase family 1 protein [Mucilaginibacter sp. AW1-3]